MRFRNAVTHPEDNRTADDLLFAGAAMRLRPGMQPEYVIDPRYGLHDAIEDLVAAAEVPCSQQRGLCLPAWSGTTTVDAAWSDPISRPGGSRNRPKRPGTALSRAPGNACRGGASHGGPLGPERIVLVVRG